MFKISPQELLSMYVDKKMSLREIELKTGINRKLLSKMVKDLGVVVNPGHRVDEEFYKLIISEKINIFLKN